MRDRHSEANDLYNFAVSLLNAGHTAGARGFAEKAKSIFELIGEPAFIKQAEQLLAACE